jgi:hypothetical protein
MRRIADAGWLVRWRTWGTLFKKCAHPFKIACGEVVPLFEYFFLSFGWISRKGEWMRELTCQLYSATAPAKFCERFLSKERSFFADITALALGKMIIFCKIIPLFPKRPSKQIHIQIRIWKCEQYWIISLWVRS